MKYKDKAVIVAAGIIVIATTTVGFQVHANRNSTQAEKGLPFAVVKTEAQWKRHLTPDQFRVLRQKGTETAFTGAYDHFYKKGIYRCAACGNDLFTSDTKFNSGTGWPSFWAPLSRHSVRTRPDYSDGMERTEVLCDRCGGHLGHVFDDGPKPTGLRYCMNSVALQFVSQDQLRQEAKKRADAAKGKGAPEKP